MGYCEYYICEMENELFHLEHDVVRAFARGRRVFVSVSVQAKCVKATIRRMSYVKSRGMTTML